MHEKRNPDEVLFSGRSTVLATKLGERLSASSQKGGTVSALRSKSTKSLVDEAKKLGWMPASLLSMLKGTGDTSATEAAAASPNDTSVVCATSSDIDEQVKVALGLDFVVRMANDDMLRPPRPNATVTEPIPIRKEKQANERMRFSAVALADWWGHGDPTRTCEDRQQIATAACRQVACDHGHAKSTGGSQLYKWRDQLYKSLADGISNPIGRKEVRGRKAHTDMIEEKEPGHLRELHRHAARMKGAMATFKELADCMSAKSATPDEDRLTISLHRLQLFRWWKKQGGKEKSSIEKPRLTPEHCRKRLDWIEKWEDITTDPNIPVACLDEKWFCTAARRRKIKMLPGPIHSLASLTVQRNGNYRTLGQWLRSQAVNDVGNLLLHTLAIITLSTTSLVELPLLTFLLGVVPTHIFLCVILQGTAREKFSFYQRCLGRDILDHTHEIAHDELAAWLGNLAPASCMHVYVETGIDKRARVVYEYAKYIKGHGLPRIDGRRYRRQHREYITSKLVREVLSFTKPRKPQPSVMTKRK